LLAKLNLGDVADKFETDLELRKLVQAYGDRLVLGWTTESSCRPGILGAEECPVTHPDALALHPEGYRKFGFQHVKFGAGGFQRLETPLMSLVTFIANIPMYNEVASHAGFFNAFPDPDGYIRRTSLLMFADG